MSPEVPLTPPEAVRIQSAAAPSAASAADTAASTPRTHRTDASYDAADPAVNASLATWLPAASHSRFAAGDTESPGGNVDECGGSSSGSSLSQPGSPGKLRQVYQLGIGPPPTEAQQQAAANQRGPLKESDAGSAAGGGGDKRIIALQLPEWNSDTNLEAAADARDVAAAQSGAARGTADSALDAAAVAQAGAAAAANGADRPAGDSGGSSASSPSQGRNQGRSDAGRSFSDVSLSGVDNIPRSEATAGAQAEVLLADADGSCLPQGEQGDPAKLAAAVAAAASGYKPQPQVRLLAHCCGKTEA